MISILQPTVSCVTVTKGRVDLLKESVHCYLMQSYPHRELVVLSQSNDRENQETENFLRSLDRSDVMFHIAPPDLSLGEMRNAVCELTTGEIVCQWDDDDLYHPDRIRAQLIALLSHTGNIASAYTQFIKSISNDYYWCDWSRESKTICRFLPGTVMFWKSVFHHWNSLLYPQQGAQSSKEEDLNVLGKLLTLGPVCPVTLGYQYVYRFHGKNTYDLNHHRLSIDTCSGKVVWTVEQLRIAEEVLRRTFEMIGVKNARVRSLDAIAFSVP